MKDPIPIAQAKVNDPLPGLNGAVDPAGYHYGRLWGLPCALLEMLEDAGVHPTDHKRDAAHQPGVVQRWRDGLYVEDRVVAAAAFIEEGG